MNVTPGPLWPHFLPGHHHHSVADEHIQQKVNLRDPPVVLTFNLKTPTKTTSSIIDFFHNIDLYFELDFVLDLVFDKSILDLDFDLDLDLELDLNKTVVLK